MRVYGDKSDGSHVTRFTILLAETLLALLLLSINRRDKSDGSHVTRFTIYLLALLLRFFFFLLLFSHFCFAETLLALLFLSIARRVKATAFTLRALVVQKYLRY